MNKRKREILAALAPAVEFAGRPGVGQNERRPGDVPGLAMHARVSAAAPAELLIYGPIGGWDGIGAADVAAVLRDAGPGPINVRINSPGGDVFQGTAIYNMLMRHPGTVETFNDGIAASAASVILMAGATVHTAKNAMTMIHDGMTGPYGNAKTIRRAADLLDQISDVIAEIYADRAGEDAAHWRALMTVNEEDGSWFTGAQAYDMGLVDSVIEPPDDGPDETLVWDRVRTWADRMPAAVLAELPRLAVEDDADDDEHDDAEPVEMESVPDAPALPEPDIEQQDKDFAHSMSMWAFLNGHPARNGVTSV